MITAKKIIIAGATGLIGKKLYALLEQKKYQIYIISRDKKAAAHTFPNATATMEWKEREKIATTLNGANGVINLAGAPIIGKRWTENYKKLLYTSRINTTKTLTEIMHTVTNKPSVLINGSAVGIYGMHDKTEPFTENDPPVNDMLANICKEWEQAAQAAEVDGIRVVYIRTAIVLDKEEGALPKMLLPFKFYAGGSIGSGKQPFPWIHIDDEVGIIIYALEHAIVTGPVNAVSPEMVTNKEFVQVLGKILHKPSLMPIPSFVLRILYGEAAQVLTTGVNVSPEKIVREGYIFKHVRLEMALKNVLNSK